MRFTTQVAVCIITIASIHSYQTDNAVRGVPPTVTIQPGAVMLSYHSFLSSFLFLSTLLYSVVMRKLVVCISPYASIKVSNIPQTTPMIPHRPIHNVLGEI